METGTCDHLLTDTYLSVLRARAVTLTPLHAGQNKGLKNLREATRLVVNVGEKVLFQRAGVRGACRSVKQLAENQDPVFG